MHVIWLYQPTTISTPKRLLRFWKLALTFVVMTAVLFACWPLAAGITFAWCILRFSK